MCVLEVVPGVFFSLGPFLLRSRLLCAACASCLRVPVIFGVRKMSSTRRTRRLDSLFGSSAALGIPAYMYYKKNFGDNKQIVHRQYVVGVLCVNGEKVRPHCWSCCSATEDMPNQPPQKYIFCHFFCKANSTKENVNPSPLCISQGSQQPNTKLCQTTKTISALDSGY